jgi:hypothetical protein
MFINMPCKIRHLVIVDNIPQSNKYTFIYQQETLVISTERNRVSMSK